MEQKIQHLMDRIDLDRVDLRAIREAKDPAGVLVQYLSDRKAGDFRFEYDQKPEMLAFLRERYDRWKEFDPREADQLAALTIPDAQRPRALSRVIALGQAWWATGNPSYGHAFQRFYEETPTGGMFNWDAFNGSQGVHELNAWFLLRDCPGFTRDGRIAYLDHLIAIADNAWDDATSQWSLSALGPEGHNWWLHGMHVLPFIGCLFPEFKRAEFFLKTGFGVVEEHLRAHYRADGGAREATPSYNEGSVVCLWDFYQLAQRNDYPLSADFETRLLRATHFLLRLGTPAGCVPVYGDSHGTPGSLTHLAALAAAVSGDGECKAYAERWRGLRADIRPEAPGELPETAFWCTGLDGAKTYAETKLARLDGHSVLMGPTGFAAMRSSLESDATYLAMASAERGPIVTSHGHNDVFSIEAWAGGVRFIGSQGCAPYGTSPGRIYDESTEGHSCLTVKGEEQVPVVSEWRWTHQLRPVVTRWISTPTHDFFHGVHEGFYRWPDHQVLHARKVFFRKPRHVGETGYWVVMDWVETERARDFAIYFHGCVAAREQGLRVILGDEQRVCLHLVPPDGDGLKLTRVDHPARRAYLLEKKLDADQNPCWMYEQATASHCFVWALLPVHAGGKVAQVRRVPVQQNGKPAGPADATAVELRWDDYAELLCVSHKPYDTQLEYAGRRAWGVLACNVYGLDRVHTAADGACGF